MNHDSKIKHLEFIQAIINRLAGNSFWVKGWTLTLVAGLLAIATKSINTKLRVVAYIPVIFFWVLDGYFLWQERLFRSLYNEVRVKKEEQIDFSMDIKEFRNRKNSWLGGIFSKPLFIFYAPLIGIMIVIIYFLR